MKNKKKTTDVYKKTCFLCCQEYGQQDVDEHMHSYAHHLAIEELKGSEQVHKCWACDISMMGLEQYNKHIATNEHKSNLLKFPQKRCTQSLLVNYIVELNDDERKALYAKRELHRDKQKGLKRCFVCRDCFPEQEMDTHMHNMMHHQAIEQLMGSEQVHKCWACDVSMTGLWLYKKHIVTCDHKQMLLNLQKRRNDGQNEVDYSVEIDDELKALCNKRDKKKNLKMQAKFLKWMDARAKFKNAKIKTSVEFTSNNVPSSSNLNSSWGKLEPNVAASMQLIHKIPKRRIEGTPDMDSLSGTLVKRPCLEVPSENLSQEMSTCGTCPSPDGKVSNVCTTENELGVSAEPMCAPEMVRGDECHISTMLGTIPKSLDNQGHKDKHVKKKGRPVKGWISKQSINHLDREKNIEESCSSDVISALRSHKQGEIKSNSLLQAVDISTLAENRNEMVPSENKQAAALSCSSSQTELNKPSWRAAGGVSSLLRGKCLQTSKSKLQQELDNSRESLHGQKPYVFPVSSETSLAKRFESPTSGTYNTDDCQIKENCEEVQPHYTVCVKGTELKDLNCFETASWQTKRKKTNISNTIQLNPKTNTSSKKKHLNELMTQSLREEELNSSLENVGDQLLKAYSTLQYAYTEVQHLLAVKQQVSSEMGFLRTKRIKILKDLKNTSDSDTSVGECSTYSDQQETLNAS
ncbi:uncharacterized protein LOC127624169 [Xyrauchen texanus]|uniref:uncharacterized protein LOC127624169 n=1 Tax=Xyrauchen texanus TaxID=154827 RepID=UPI002242222F|nr:uncharacterized protein LOC127624169 [Xyrauchen texanus]